MSKKRNPKVKTAPPASESMTCWLTADSDPATGELLAGVVRWLARPERVVDGRGAYWQLPAGSSVSVDTAIGPQPAKFDVQPRERILFSHGTAPDSDRECVRIG